MKNFEYEWWTVEVQESSGLITWEIKAKSKENAIKQINQRVSYQNKCAADESLPWWERGSMVYQVIWDTLKQDRVGYQRLF